MRIASLKIEQTIYFSPPATDKNCPGDILLFPDCITELCPEESCRAICNRSRFVLVLPVTIPQEIAMFHDQLILCRDCQSEFTFCAGEQEYFATKSLSNQPKRCPNCRVEARVRRSGKTNVITHSVCATCGTETKVPFHPRGHKPIFCIACLAVERNKGRAEQARVPANLNNTCVLQTEVYSVQVG